MSIGFFVKLTIASVLSLCVGTNCWAASSFSPLSQCFLVISRVADRLKLSVLDIRFLIAYCKVYGKAKAGLLHNAFSRQNLSRCSKAGAADCSSVASHVAATDNRWKILTATVTETTSIKSAADSAAQFIVDKVIERPVGMVGFCLSFMCQLRLFFLRTDLLS